MLYLVVRAGVGIRYRLRVRGLEHLSPKAGKGGILFLPNHPAEIDPIILTLVLWNRYKAHPLVVEQFYHLRGTHWIQKLVGAVPIPDLNGMVNKWKQKKLEKCFEQIIQGLKQGSHYLIYPSGRLKQGAAEIIGGASFVHNVAQACPEANLVLVRTTGLWGSRFSRALTGSTPDFGKVLWEGFKVVLKNLIFLTPRREVTIEFEPVPEGFPLKAPRLEFNQALEKWYNFRGPEPLKLVSDHFWNESYPEVAVVQESQKRQVFVIAPEIEHEIVGKIAQLAKKESVRRSDHLARDLGLDSLDVADLQTFLIERYEISELVAEEIQTVEDVLHKVASPQHRKPLESKGKAKWPREESRPLPLAPQGSSIQEAFLTVCDRMESYIACADDRLGVLSYRRLKLIVLTLSYHFRKLKEKRVGILLPSSTMSYAIVIALLLADKIPVMLNWTVGAKALNHCKEAAGLQTVLSSNYFLEHLADGDLGQLDDLLVPMEEVHSLISWWDRIRGFAGLFKDARHLLKTLHLTDVSPDDPAVILFTSGTEALPKGVPLSHKNLLCNQQAGMSCISLLPTDILYGILPPFHSFGFSVTGLFPLLTGLKVLYAPDPTQYFSMASDIEKWKVTLLCSAPTFLAGLFHAAKPQQLQTVRLAVGGAEKVPAALFAFMEKQGGVMLEGYGITECGPIVSLTRPDKPREGVGTPVPGVEIKILHPETSEEVSGEGEIAIYGPSVFAGYLETRASPFIEKEGKQWYRSGDLGYLTPTGSLVLSGRLKRFVKIGGEMVSLSGIEEELVHLAQQKGWVVSQPNGAPSLAAVAAEKNSEKPLIIIFSTFKISKDTLNDALRERGFGRMIKIADVRSVGQIPITGTGKTNYRALEEML